LQRKIQGKKNMNTSDLSARANLISKIPTAGDNIGIAYASINVNIQYDPLSDEFTADILSQNIDAAKTEAEEWLKTFGLSKYAICNLPLAFYPAPEIEYALPAGTAFNTEALSCKQLIKTAADGNTTLPTPTTTQPSNNPGGNTTLPTPTLYSM
jgi:hypothetical protein